MKKELPWKISIEKISNGYILRWSEETERGAYREVIDVVEEDEYMGDLEAAQSMLWLILEHFGIYKGINIELEEEKEDY